MSNDFEIKNGVLVKYHGSDAHVTVPDDVTEIGRSAFKGCTRLSSVVIPDSVTEIGSSAFEHCTSLTSVVIPNSVTKIGRAAFADCSSLPSVSIPNSIKVIERATFVGCTNLTSIDIPDSVKVIEDEAFKRCRRLVSVVIPDSVTKVTKIGDYTFDKYARLVSVVIPDSVTMIGDQAFRGCTNLSSVDIPNNVTMIGCQAFRGCTNLSSVDIPDSVTEIGDRAFNGCAALSDDNGFVIIRDVLYSFHGANTSVIIPNEITKIGSGAFENCTSLTSVVIPNSVTEIDDSAFEGCTNLSSIVIPDSVKSISLHNNLLNTTVICSEGSNAHRVCIDHHISFLFDFQYEAFHGLIPPRIETLSSPFLADEEQPYVFISYSHKDRDRVLPILKTLYEAGWRIWYDEGLTIGDSYDETLEKHVRECSAFLLFVTENSLNSLYIEKNEVPWAIRFEKPIVKCILDDGEDYEISEGSVIATVSPSTIEPALGIIDGLTKGEPRTAKGITVAVDPANRNEAAGGDGFAYCLYAPQSAATAKAILLEAKNGGCNLYEAVEKGADEEKLQSAACLIVFLDKAFLSDQALSRLLTEAYQAEKEIIVCRLEDVKVGDYPPELSELDKMHALNFVHGITSDMNKKLTRHMQKRGCRDTAALPGFEYEKTDTGIVIKKYTGTDSEPKLESVYGGIPVVEIAEEAFENCLRLKSFIIPDGVREIGDSAFAGCTSLSSLVIPDSVTKIGDSTFEGCTSLSSLVIPDSVTIIGDSTFEGCTSLSSLVIPDSITKIGDSTFAGCTSLSSLIIPESVTEIGCYAFCSCTSLSSVVIPDSVTEIDSGTFEGCRSMSSIVIPDSITEIGIWAFSNCKSLTVFCPRFSYARKYCKKNKIPVKSIKHAKKQ